MSRQPLDEISGNSNYQRDIEGRFELTPHWRSYIVGRAAAGQTSKAIASHLNIPISTIRYTLEKADERYENEFLYRSGCPKIVFKSLRRLRFRKVHANSKIRYKDLQLNLDLDKKAVLKTTLYGILKKESIIN